MGHDADIEKALEEFSKTRSPIIAIIARKHGVHRSTLSRRARGITVSRTVATSTTHKLLTDAQEEALLKDMEFLSNKGIYLAPRIIRNTVERLVSHTIGKDWVRNFHRRHKDRVISMKLVGFDRKRVIADNAKYINEFYTKVRLLLLLEVINY
jgi:hypothetical protein